MNVEGLDERRQVERLAPPKPCWRIMLLLLSDKLAKLMLSSKTGLAIVLFIFASCSVAIVWSIYYRLPSIDRSSLLLNQQIRLQMQLEDLKTTWSEEELQLIETTISQEQAKIFDDFPTFAGWLKRKAEYANQLGLDMSYRLNEQQRTRLDGILSVVMKINLKVRPDVADKAYVRLLEFMRSLIDENRHLEISGNELRSNGKGAKTMSLDIVAWLKDENAISESLVFDSEENADVPFVQE